MRRFLLAIVPLLWGASAQGEACGCDDVRDLRNRICEARAAVAEYDRQIARIQKFEREQLKKPLLWTGPLYKQCMQPCIQEALDAIVDLKARTSAAETNDGCEIVFTTPPATACVKESLLRHERVHQTQCVARRDAIKEGGFFGPIVSMFTGNFDGQSLVSVANEEKMGYRGEIEFALEQLRRLSAKCPRAAFEIERNGGREFTLDYCPPARPRPAPEDSLCPARCPLAVQQLTGG